MLTPAYIRTDGNSTIGLGHLVRCIALAQMLQKTFDIHFFCKEITASIETQIKNLGFTLHKIASENDFLSIITKNDVVIIDGYGFDAVYQKLLFEKSKALVCIDDLHDRTFWANLIINTAPESKKEEYTAQGYTNYALGSRFALLRPNFIKQARKPRMFRPIQTLFICFGGADPLNLTEKTLATTLSYPHFSKINVVTGSAFFHLGTLKKLREQHPKVNHFHAIDENKMLDLMLDSELAIVPASGMLSEVFTAKTIPISGNYINNQNELHAQYKKLGVIIDAGNFGEEELNIAIQQALQLNAFLPNPIDGFSDVRILLKFAAWAKESPLTLRIADQTDLGKTFEWASNPSIRAFSPNKTIVFEEHAAWFNQKIQSPDCVYLIAEVNRVPVGSIRFDIKHGTATISYLVDPLFQKLGLGTRLLQMGVDFLQKMEIYESITSIQGFVMPENLASIKSFENQSYMKTWDGEMFKFEKYVDR